MSDLARLPVWPVVMATVGLPGSGKTEWARQQVAGFRAAGVTATRISRDDVRELLGLVVHDDEDRVTRVQFDLIGRHLAAGCQLVIVDDTNLRREFHPAMEALANQHGAGFTLNTSCLGVPVDVCIERDAFREPPKRVGPDVIRAMHRAALPHWSELTP